MAKERISSNVPRKTSVAVTQAADALGISVSRYIEIALETELDKLDIRIQTHEAHRQRDCFKGKMEQAQADLAAAEAKIEALKNRGLFARIFNCKPKI